jgi:hypothetical protein
MIIVCVGKQSDGALVAQAQQQRKLFRIIHELLIGMTMWLGNNPKKMHEVGTRTVAVSGLLTFITKKPFPSNKHLFDSTIAIVSTRC